MGTPQSTSLNTDSDGILTSSEFSDSGDGNEKWLIFTRTADGGDAAAGATDDAAVTDPTASGSIIAFLKGILSFLRVSAAGVGKAEDAAHASGDTGIMVLAVRRDTAAASSDTTGDYEPLQTDSLGQLRVATGKLSVVHTAALVASQIVKSSAGTLHSIVGYVASGEDGFIQVHDAVSAPADTAVPEISVFIAAATAHQAVNIPLPGHVCATGITLVWSTTGPTKTIGAAKMMVAAHYE